MSQMLRKVVNRNGQDMVMTTDDIEYADGILKINDVNPASAAALTSAVRVHRKESNGPLTIYINSPGGSVTDGMSMYDTLKASGCEITTVATGMAASMGAFLLAAAGTKGKRWAQPNAQILIHQPLGGTSGQASDMKIHVQNILNVRDRLNRILAECTGQTVEKIEADTERDNIMDAETALAYGLIDRIGDPIEEY